MKLTTRPRHVAVAAALAVAALAPALAQNTTSGISGTVLGADGQPAAGATVTIVHVESGSTNTVTTDAAGRYSARGLRAGGPYTVTVSRAGQSEKREGLFLNLAETLSYDARLGGSAQVITITGRSANERFNRSNMGAGTSLGSREVGALASIQRNLQDLARTDPRLSQTDKERGEISAAGQNTRYNSITIDGVTTNDTFGLESNNLPTIKQPISIDAIQSVQVNISNYDVTQRGYTGANINAVTKSGTNDLRGSVYTVYRDETLVGARYNRTDQTFFYPSAFKEATTGFTLGGPILKDKLFFFGSYEQFTSSRNSPDFGPLGSSRTNVGITQSAVDSAINIARSTWNIDVGNSDIPQGLRAEVKDTLLKLDWNISDLHRANLRYTKTVQSEPNIVGFSPTGLSLSSWWYTQEKQLESLVGQWFADWTPSFSTEVKLSSRKYDSEPFPVNGARLPSIGLRFSGALPAGTPSSVSSNNRFLNMGTELSRHFNVLRTDTVDAYAGATLSLGAHELKFGLDWAENEIYNAFLQNSNGNYTFGCEGVASQAVTYSFGTVGGPAGPGRVAADCTGLTPAQRELATLENFQQGRVSAYTLRAPLAGRTLDDGVAVWSYTNTGVFLQDTWKLGKTFTLMAGMRMDQQNVPTKPLANTTVAQPLVAGVVDATQTANGGVTRNSGGFGVDNTQTLDGNQLVQPRVGFNWNLGNDERRMQLRGGFGLFQGAAANVWLSNPFTNTGRAVAVFSCATYADCQTRGATFNPNPRTQTFSGVIPAADVDILSPDLEQPSVWKTNIAFESELPRSWPVIGGLTASAEWLHTKTNSGIFYEHLNLGAPTRIGPDGRQLFWTPNAYSQTATATAPNPCWTTTGGLVTSGSCAGLRNRAFSNPNFNNVLYARETKKGGGDSVTLSISQPTGPSGLGWTLAYTRTDAQDVSPLTSSISNSNWQNRNIFNPNEEVLSNSNYLVKDRVSASVTWSKALVGSYRTTFGMFYEGRRGKPYSWTFINDMNGDGVGGNDLMYIPSGPGSGEVIFRGRSATETAAQAEAAFWDVVNANSGLSSARGGVVGRNNNYAPWVNNVDIRVSQEIPGFWKDHKATFQVDLLNFGNMLSRKWGRIDEIGFPSNRSFVNFTGVDAATGKYIYTMGSTEDFVTRQATGESQWAIQVTLRYSF